MARRRLARREGARIVHDWQHERNAIEFCMPRPAPLGPPVRVRVAQFRIEPGPTQITFNLIRRAPKLNVQTQAPVMNC